MVDRINHLMMIGKLIILPEQEAFLLQNLSFAYLQAGKHQEADSEEIKGREDRA